MHLQVQVWSWSPFTLTCPVPHNYSTFSKTGSTRENGHKLPVAPLRTLPKVRSGQVGPSRMRAGRLCGGGADLKYFDAQVKIPRTFFPPPPVAGAAESTILGLWRLPTSAVWEPRLESGGGWVSSLNLWSPSHGTTEQPANLTKLTSAWSGWEEPRGRVRSRSIIPLRLSLPLAIHWPSRRRSPAGRESRAGFHHSKAMQLK